jgi:hypothetical protein
MSNIYRFKAFEILPDDFLQKLSSNYIIKNVKFTFTNEIKHPEFIELYIFIDSCFYDYMYLHYNSLEQYNNTYMYNVFPIVENKNIVYDFECIGVYELDIHYNCDLEIELIYQDQIIYLIKYNTYDFELNDDTLYIMSNCFNSFNDLLNYLSFYLNTSIEEIEIWINEQLNNKSCLSFHKMNNIHGKILLEKLNFTIS